MTLKTRRLALRGVCHDDKELLVALRTDPHVRKYLGGPTTLADANAMVEANIALAQANIEYSRWLFVVTRLDNLESIGLVLLHHGHGGTEISYQFRPSSWSQGFAAEAVRCVMDYAFDSERIQELLAVTQTANERSCRLLQRLGWTAAEQFVEFGAQQTLYRARQRQPGADD
ncbi:MAG: GNAT family N-acetyltransferase [Actinobacteria bacterium]|nr:GNAT family N-acetyltransferase [Actinomycetota bacterium]